VFAGVVVGAHQEVYVEDTTCVVSHGHSHRVPHGDHNGCKSSMPCSCIVCTNNNASPPYLRIYAADVFIKDVH